MNKLFISRGNAAALLAEDIVAAERHRGAQGTPQELLGQLTYWVCAMSVDQHATICKKVFSEADSVTGKVFEKCNCNSPLRTDRDLSEVNKFDELMNYLMENVEGFTHVIVVDRNLEVFGRAWCVAEIAEGRLSGIPQRLLLPSNDVLRAELIRTLM